MTIGLQRPLHEAEKVKVRFQWRSQYVGDVNYLKRTLAFFVAIIKHPEKKKKNNLREKGVYFGLQFQKDRVHHCEESIETDAGLWLITLHMHSGNRTRSEDGL